MTKRSFIITLLMVLLVTAPGGDVHAQFWKRKKHSHKKNQKSSDKSKDTRADDERNEEAVKEPGEKGAHTLSKKEKKELRKKEKREKKEREKEERRKKKEKETQDKKDKKNKKGKTPANQQDAPVAVVRKWSDIEYVPTQKKAHYRIELLAPLYLDELVKNGYASREIPDKAQAGINFYKGVQIAADSLKKAGFDIDIYVHDVTSLLESADMLVRKNSLDTADLVLGAVTPKDVPVLAGYAKTKHINFVSATAGADGAVRDNQYFTMLQPSLQSSCEWIGQHIEELHPRNKVLLFYRTYVQADGSAYRYLTEDTAYRKMYVPVLCNNLPKKQELEKLVDTARVNTVVVAIMDNNYSDSVLRLLKHDFPRVKFEVYGMPSWAAMSSLAKAGSYSNLNINVPVPFSYDASNASVQYVDKVFRREYGGKPQEMVYRGYEALFWYANLLRRHGTIFNKQYNDDEVAPMTKFEIRPQWDRVGNVLYMENKHISLTRYENIR